MKENKSLVYEPRPKVDHPNIKHWEKVRSKAISRDGGRCQTCYSSENLEAHHRTYMRFGNEVIDDVITLCKECHYAITDSIRERRYRLKHGLSPKEHKSVNKNFNEDVELFKAELKDYRSSSPDHAQRSDGRPPE